ncbi:MAG: D-aminoacyl-tRNA deacylase [Longimicrobiales bacterium]|nr:D-aminoacyl-tRNA deacylase [Longimicrobiales bacterium]
MRVVLQRVSRASVSISGETVGEIAGGLVLLVGFTEGDHADTLQWMAEKVLGLRVFSDDEGKMNLSLEEVGGDLLVISQFTLYGDTRKGRRPSFVHAAPPEVAVPLYDEFLRLLEEAAPGKVESGEFGAMMDVALVNAGPVTLVLER